MGNRITKTIGDIIDKQAVWMRAKRIARSEIEKPRLAPFIAKQQARKYNREIHLKTQQIYEEIMENLERETPSEDAKTQQFVNDSSVTHDDIRVLQAIRHDLIRVQNAGWCEAGALTPDEYITHIKANGIWSAQSGWETADNGRNPRTLVRVAQLVENHLAEQEGGRWETVSIFYPTPSFWATDENDIPNMRSKVRVRVKCVSGRNAGMVVTVSYYRWAVPTRFAYPNLDEVNEVFYGTMDDGYDALDMEEFEDLESGLDAFD